MHLKLAGKPIFTDELHCKFFQIGFLIHFSYWNLFPFIPIYFQLGNISGNVSGNISRGINSPEFNNPNSWHKSLTLAGSTLDKLNIHKQVVQAVREYFWPKFSECFKTCT